ncbi:hypothetical protein YPPY99_2265, partial [Yersinia pestis PY-99]
MLLGMADGA